MTQDLRTQLGGVESASLEFKRQAEDRQEIRRAICALANDLPGTGGGDLLIGVDKDGAAYPVDVSDEALLKITSIRNEGKILDLPSLLVERAMWSGEPVIHVRVTASATPPVRLDGVAWVRPGPQTVRASASDERLLTERRSALALLTPDLRPVLSATGKDLDLELLTSTYVTSAVDPEVLEENGRPVHQQLASLRLLDPQGTPTLLGVLLGGFDPSAHIPGAYVQFVRYAGRDAGAPVQDEEELRDNLITAARSLGALLQGNVRQWPVAEGALTETVRADYPLPALREAVWNAVSHRTYDGSNAPVRILWFDDRVEISSPGGPFGVVTAENFDRVNDYRNPALAAAMKTLGYVNRFGRGIGRMRQEMAKGGNPEPEFEVTPDYWTVILRSRA